LRISALTMFPTSHWDPLSVFIHLSHGKLSKRYYRFIFTKNFIQSVSMDYNGFSPQKKTIYCEPLMDFQLWFQIRTSTCWALVHDIHPLISDSNSLLLANNLVT
jgi:hypothetical protein